jgi:hypothetical protein
MKYIFAHKMTLLGLVVGALLGYLYFQEIGCESGTCAITSKPLNSTLYGAFMGGLLANSFKKNEQKSKSNEH